MVPRRAVGPQTNIDQMNTRMVVGAAGRGVCPVTWGPSLAHTGWAPLPQGHRKCSPWAACCSLKPLPWSSSSRKPQAPPELSAPRGCSRGNWALQLLFPLVLACACPLGPGEFYLLPGAHLSEEVRSDVERWEPPGRPRPDYPGGLGMNGIVSPPPKKIHWHPIPQHLRMGSSLEIKR